MADAPFATPADIANIWRPLTDGEQTTATTYLEVASAIIRGRFADIDARIESGAISAVVVRHVAATMVKRVMAQRDPEAPIEEQAGPFRERWEKATADGLSLDGDDLAMLAPRGGGRPRSHALGLGICPP